jgi:hypothetical protein
LTKPLASISRAILYETNCSGSAFFAAGAALALFVRWEQRSDHPMLPLTLFRDRRFSTGSGVVTVAFFVMFGFFFLMTQYLQFGRGYSPLEAGLAGLPLALAMPCTTVQKMIGAISILISLMKASPNGFICAAMAG